MVETDLYIYGAVFLTQLESGEHIAASATYYVLYAIRHNLMLQFYTSANKTHTWA